MTYRVYVNVNRGIMDATAVCVFPWEVAILEEIHGEQAQLASAEEMGSTKGAVSIKPLKMPYNPDCDPQKPWAQQLTERQRVDLADDPFHDLGAEYERLVNLYGMDKELPMPVVKKIYGSPSQFAQAIKKYRKGSLPPADIDALIHGVGDEEIDDADDENLDDIAPSDMKINQLRAALKARGVEMPNRATRDDLVELLTQQLAEAA